MNVCCSFCRITGKSRNQPKAHYPPLIPMPKPNIEELRRKYCHITAHRMESHSYCPAIDQDSKIPRARICRIMHKSHSMENHRYIPTFEDVAFSHLENCRITQHYAKSGYNFMYPLIAQEDRRKLTEEELSMLQCCITHGHHMNNNFKYFAPIMDDEEMIKLHERLHNQSSLAFLQQDIPEDRKYVYPVMGDEINIIVPYELEEMLRSAEIESVMTSKEGDKIVIATKNDETFILNTHLMTPEEVHEELVNGTLMPGFGGGRSFIKQSSEERAITPKVKKMRKHYTLDLSEIQQAMGNKDAQSSDAVSSHDGASCCEKSKETSANSHQVVPQEELTCMSDEQLGHVAAELLTSFMQTLGVTAQEIIDVKKRKYQRKRKVNAKVASDVKTPKNASDKTVPPLNKKKRGKLSREKAVTDESDELSLSRDSPDALIHGEVAEVTSNGQISEDNKSAQSGTNATTHAQPNCDRLLLKAMAAFEKISSSVNGKINNCHPVSQEAKDALVELMAGFIQTSPVNDFDGQAMSNDNLLNQLNIKSEEVQEAIAHFAMNGMSKKFLSNEIKIDTSTNLTNDNSHKILINLVDNLMLTAVVTGTLEKSSAILPDDSFSPELLNLLEKVNSNELRSMTESVLDNEKLKMKNKADALELSDKKRNTVQASANPPLQMHSAAELENARSILAELLPQLTMVATDNGVTDFVQNLAVELATIQTALTQASDNDTNSYRDVFQNLAQELCSTIAALPAKAQAGVTTTSPTPWQRESDDDCAVQVRSKVHNQLTALQQCLSKIVVLPGTEENSSRISHSDSSIEMDKGALSSDKPTFLAQTASQEQCNIAATPLAYMKEKYQVQKAKMGSGLKFIAGPDWDEIRAAQDGFDFSFFNSMDEENKSENQAVPEKAKELSNESEMLKSQAEEKMVFQCTAPGQFAIPILEQSVWDEAAKQPELICKRSGDNQQVIKPKDKESAVISAGKVAVQSEMTKTIDYDVSAPISLSSSPVLIEGGVALVLPETMELSENIIVSSVHPDDFSSLEFFNILQEEALSQFTLGETEIKGLHERVADLSAQQQLQSAAKTALNKDGGLIEEKIGKAIDIVNGEKLLEIFSQSKYGSEHVEDVIISTAKEFAKETKTHALSVGHILTEEGPQTVTVQQIETKSGNRVLSMGYIQTNEGRRLVAIGQIHTPDGAKGIALGQIQTPDGPKMVALGQMSSLGGTKLVALGHIQADNERQLLALEQMSTKEGTHVVAVQQIRFHELSNIAELAPGGNKLETISLNEINTDVGPKSVNVGQIRTAEGVKSLIFGQMDTSGGPKVVTLGQIKTKDGVKTVAVGQILTKDGVKTMALGHIQTSDGPKMVALGQIETPQGTKLVPLAQIQTEQGPVLMAVGQIQTPFGTKLVAMSHTQSENGTKAVIMKEINPKDLPKMVDYTRNLETFSSTEHESSSQVDSTSVSNIELANYEFDASVCQSVQTTTIETKSTKLTESTLEVFSVESSEKFVYEQSSHNPGNPHPNIGNPHNKSINPGNPYPNPGNPHHNPGNPHSNPGNPHPNPGNPHGNPGNPHHNPENPNPNPPTEEQPTKYAVLTKLLGSRVPHERIQLALEKGDLSTNFLVIGQFVDTDEGVKFALGRMEQTEEGMAFQMVGSEEALLEATMAIPIQVVDVGKDRKIVLAKLNISGRVMQTETSSFREKLSSLAVTESVFEEESSETVTITTEAPTSTRRNQGRSRFKRSQAKKQMASEHDAPSMKKFRSMFTRKASIPSGGLLSSGVEELFTDYHALGMEDLIPLSEETVALLLFSVYQAAAKGEVHLSESLQSEIAQYHSKEQRLSDEREGLEVLKELESEVFDLYVAIADYIPESTDTEAIPVCEGQIVEVLDSHSSQKWLVRTRPTKTSPSKQGWVPRSYLEKKTLSSTLRSIQEILELEADATTDSREREAIRKRSLVVKELVETEEEFSKDMTQVVNTYIRDLENPRVPKEIKDLRDAVFMNFSKICDFHNNVLIKGVQYYANEPVKLGKTFLRLERDFDMHVNYCRDEPQAQAILLVSPAKEFFEQYSQRIGEIDKTLADHLKLPIQRINDYQLLLKELIKYSARLKEDCGDLQKALDLMLSIPQRANDLKFINSIEGYKGNLLKLGRLLRHDWFTVTDKEKKNKERYLFLFKSRILVTKVYRINEERSTFILKEIIKLPDIEVNDLVSDKCSFELHHKEKDYQNYPLKLNAKTEFIKEAWLKEIRELAPDLAIAVEQGIEEIEVAPVSASPLEALEEVREESLAVTESVRSGSVTSMDALEVPKEDERPTTPGGTILPHPPIFAIKFKDAEVFEESCVTFMLKIHAMPDADIKFYKDDTELKFDDRVKLVIEDKETFELVIINVVPGDAGKYRCVAKNSEGEASVEANVTVSGEKKVFLGIDEADKARSVTPAGEEPDFKWYRDGQEFEASERFKVMYKDQEDTLALVFQHVKPEDAGLYTCVAATASGNISCSAELTVQGGVNQLLRDPEVPKVTAELTDTEVAAGGSAMLELKFSGYPKPEVTWFKDKTEVQAGGRFRFLHEDDESLALIIKNVVADDSGRYKVVVKNELGEAATSCDLVVKAPPTFKKQLKDVTVMTNEMVRIEVEIEGKPTPEVSWYKDGQLVSGSDRIQIIHEKGDVFALVIKKALGEDAGSYSCVASNSSGKISEFSNLTINVPPGFLKEIKSVECKESDTVKFEVKVTGTPIPKVSWSKNGEEIKADGKRIKIEQDERNYSLSIEKVTRTETAKYSCTITNQYGSSSSDGTLTVNCIPEFSQKLSDKTVKEDDENVRLEVKMSGTPTPKIKWFIESMEITEKSNNYKIVNEGEVQALIIKKVSADCSGKFTCQATNSIGELKSAAVLNVLTKPKFKQTLSDKEVTEGDSVSYTVNITGNPAPEVKWYKNNKEVTVDANIKIKHDSTETWTLTLDHVTGATSGEYECRAKNTEGDAKSSSKLVVNTKPTFEKGLTNLDAWLGLPADIEVKIQGVPDPNVTWSKNGQAISASERIKIEKDGQICRLAIKETTVDDSASYKCTIKNKIGEASTEGTLKVKTPADATFPVCIKSLTNLTSVRYDPSSFEAKILGNPKPDVKWMKDGVELAEGGLISFKEVAEEYLYRITVEKTVVEDMGTYSILAVNEHGQITSTAALNVHVPPEIVAPMDRKIMPKGTTTYEVTVTGRPTPKISWHRNGKALTEGTKFKWTVDDAKQLYCFTIDGADLEDAGEYECVAENVVTKAKQPFNLFITTEQPSFPKPIESAHIKPTTPAQFDVEVAGIPMPDVKWLRSGVELGANYKIQFVKNSENSHSLIIAEFSEEDAGEYECKAISAAGEALCHARLDVKHEMPSFTRHVPKESCAIDGEQFILEAKIDGSPHPRVKWLKDGKEIVLGDRIKVESHPDGTVRLIVDNAKASDSGRYTLVLTNESGEINSAGMVKVEAVPKAPGFPEKLKKTEVLEGSPLQLNARITGHPKPLLKWFKDGKPLKSDRIHCAESTDGCISFLIHEARADDAGKYTLHIKNNLGEASCEADVIVLSAPRSPAFHIKMKHMDVYEGFPFVLEGKIVGYPVPTLKWLKDGQEIKVDGQRIISKLNPDGTFSFTVNDSTPGDTGMYTCVATNSGGEEKANAEVAVKSRTKPGEPLCAPSFITPLRDFKTEEGLPLMLQAHVTGNPVPSINWFKDGQPLKSTDRMLIGFDGDRVSLDIKKAAPTDAGKYECKLSNPEGDVTSASDVKVKKMSKAPVFTQRFPDMDVIFGQDGRFVCRVVGIPNPEMTWYFNDKPISESDKYKTKHEGDMYALYIKDCAPSDIGNVSCIAKNIDGEEKCSAFLNVVDKLDKRPKAEAPSFLKKLADCEIIEGMTGKFTACISGSPEPEFKWFKEGRELTETDRIRFDVEPHGLLRLILKDVRAGDEGKYCLKISNPHGTAESEASLNYEGYEKKPKRMLDLNVDYEKIKKTGVPFALPDKPIISKMTDRRLTLSWKPSIPVGPRVPVTYIVEMCEVPDGDWFNVRTGVRGCCCEIRNLEPYHDYKFRIRVENKYGTSDPSPYAIAYRTRLEMSPPKYLETLPAEFDFRPETSQFFPKDYDVEKTPHEAYAHAPRFLRQDDEVQYGVRNQPSSIQWFIYGYPTPTVSWLFNDEKIELINRYSSSLSRNGQATLYINRFLERDIGIYECIAVNEHGEARQRVQTEISEPPVFSKQLEETTIMLRDSGSLECRVVGTPYPEIRWYKDWHPMASSNRIKIEWKEPDLCTLTINDTISKDAGLYSCGARNIAGMTSNSVMLTIEENEADYAILNYSHSKVVKARNKPFEDSFDIGDELGRGVQGIVYHAVERATGNSYAAKIMHGKGDVRDAMNKELDAMNQFHDRHLIRAVDCFDTKKGLTLVTELAAGGELLDSLCKQSTLSEDEVAMYIRQILWGLEHMHGKGYAHLGISPGDLLLSKPGGDDLKICDFGLARRLIKGRDFIQEYGMPEYVAPEVANHRPVSFYTDMWSVGVVTYLLLSGISPFLGEHDRQTLQQVQQGKINFDPEVFSHISDDAKDFMSKLLVFDQESRLDVKQALKHPWMKWADRPGSGEKYSTDRLNSYYRKYKDWVSNSACKRFYRHRPLQSAFTHPSRMVYPPDEVYTPPSSPEMSPTVRSKPAPWDMPGFKDKVERDHENLDYDLGYQDSESRYQQGPDTYLLQLRDVGFPLRLREYMRVAGSTSPSLGVRMLDTFLGQNVSVRERRRFTDVMDEEIDDERKGVSDSSSTNKRIVSEVSPRSETRNRIKELLPSKAEDGYIPFFREKIKDEAFIEDEDVELVCFAVGDPKPIVQWYRNDVILQETHRLHFLEMPEGRSVLRFSPIKAFDAGIYKAIARNANGDATCRSRLKLGDVPGRMDAPEVTKASDTEMFVQWHLLKDTGNTTIESYDLEFKEVESTDWLSAHNQVPHEFFIIRNLKPRTLYHSRVRAKNRFGYGEFSVPSASVRTLEEGVEKVPISKAMKFQQEQTETGGLDPRPTSALDYSTEDNPLSLMSGSPTEKYNFISEISRGQFSVVIKCKHQSGDKVFAAKAIDNSSANSENALHEFEVMKSLRHERLPRLYEAFSHNDALILVMEKLQGYNVLTYLTHRHEYSEEIVTRIISQVLDALQYLHFRSFVHLDLQPDNIVMSNLQATEVKLVDLGGARKLQRSGTTLIGVKPGLLEFRAPEVINNEDISVQADIWGLGVLTYLLLSGTSPFVGDDDKETSQNITYVRYRFENLYKEITPEATRFLMQIFKKTPSKRPIADECLEHKWLNPSEYMLKKRERAVFLSSRLQQYADKYELKKRELSKCSESVTSALGAQFGRSISVECDATTTF